jgi:hypothetical protein
MFLTSRGYMKYIEASIKERLLNITKEEKLSFAFSTFSG